MEGSAAAKQFSAYLSTRISTIEAMFHLGHFHPAAVQRDFQWDEERAERLLREVTEALVAFSGLQAAKKDVEAEHAQNEPTGQDASPEEESIGEAGALGALSEAGASPAQPLPAFYIGAMVLRPAGEGKHEVFDGLQRITTLTILIAILRDLVVDDRLKARLDACVAAAPGDYRLTHAGPDATLANMVQRPGEAGVRRQNKSRPSGAAARRIFDIDRRFVVLLQRRDKSALDALARFVLENVLVGITEARDPRLARHIFVATNLYGLPLRRDEVLKGQLLALMPDTEQAERLEQTWDECRKRIADGSFEEFLICLDAIIRRQPQGADCLGDLLDHLALSESKAELKQFPDTLERHARAWVSLQEHLKYPAGGPLGNQIWRLGLFKWKEWRPLALRWMVLHQANQANAPHRARTLRRFAVLVRRCMAITLYEFGESNREEIFLSALRLATRKTPEEPFTAKGASPKPLDFSKKVRLRIKSDLELPIENFEVRRSLMLWYEAALWPNDLAPAYIMGASVEHVLPDKPELSSQWMKTFPDSEQRYLRHGSIGNLGLVDPEVNEHDLSNKDFAIKKPVLQEKGQFGKYKTLAGIETATQWLPATIEARAGNMAGDIWKRLELS